MTWFERRRDRRTERLLDRAHRDREARRIRNNPPLTPAYEAHAVRMAELGTTVLGAGETEAVRIGRLLDKAGGMSLMVAVAERADALSVRNGSGPILRHIEHAWGGIGDWMA